MIHVQTWTGSGSFRITEMLNAGKRGKTCRILRFSGWTVSRNDEPYLTINRFTGDMVAWAASLPTTSDFDAVATEARSRLVAASLPTHAASIYADEVIKGICAPRPVLTAAVPGKWSAHADIEGVVVNEDADQNNLPCCITQHGQTHARAYELAAKVWDKVKASESFSKACDVLREAGCKLHYFCRMD